MYVYKQSLNRHTHTHLRIHARTHARAYRERERERESTRARFGSESVLTFSVISPGTSVLVQSTHAPVCLSICLSVSLFACLNIFFVLVSSFIHCLTESVNVGDGMRGSKSVSWMW